VLQRIRAGLKVVVGEGGTTTTTMDESGDAFRYGPMGTEQSPCAAECGCPDSQLCSGASRSTLRIVPERSVAITLRGESPLKYFASPPTVRVRAGARQLAVFRPTRDFTWRVQVPGSVLMESGGTVTIETDKVYLPGQAEGTADARRLGLRVFEVRVEAAAQ